MDEDPPLSSWQIVRHLLTDVFVWLVLQLAYWIYRSPFLVIYFSFFILMFPLGFLFVFAVLLPRQSCLLSMLFSILIAWLLLSFRRRVPGTAALLWLGNLPESLSDKEKAYTLFCLLEVRDQTTFTNLEHWYEDVPEIIGAAERQVAR